MISNLYKRLIWPFYWPIVDEEGFDCYSVLLSATESAHLSTNLRQ